MARVQRSCQTKLFAAAIFGCSDQLLLSNCSVNCTASGPYQHQTCTGPERITELEMARTFQFHTVATYSIAALQKALPHGPSV